MPSPARHAHAGRIREIIRLGLPLLAGNLSMYLYRLADTLMVGQLGVESLAAIAVATGYTLVHEMFLWPIALGVQAIASRRIGHTGDARAAIGFLPAALGAAIVASTTALVLSLLAPVIIPLVASTAEGDVLAYVRIARISFPVLALAAAGRGVLSALKRTRALMTAVVISNVVNVALNAVFIFGLAGMPELGVRGAALGTLGGHVVLLAIVGGNALRVAIRSGGISNARLAHPVAAGAVARIVAVGLPVALQNAFAMAYIVLFQGLLGRLGAIEQAVTYALFSTFRINKSLVGGFANGAAILVGHDLGAGNTEGARSAIRSQQTIAAAIGAGNALLVFVGAPLLARAFGLTGDAARLAVLGYRIFAPAFLIEILGYSLEIIFTHNGWGRYVLMSEFLTNSVGIAAVPAIAILVLGSGIGGAWVGFALYQVGHAALLFAGYHSDRWVRVEVDTR